MKIILFALTAALFLSACGQSGKLYLPVPPIDTTASQPRVPTAE